MRKYVFLVAAITCVISVSTADARRHDRVGARCRLGLIYRPSLGTCESRSAFRQAMREAKRDVEPAARVSRRELRRVARAERRRHRRELRQAARAAAVAERAEDRPRDGQSGRTGERTGERAARLLPTRPVPDPGQAGALEEPTTTAALPSTDAPIGHCSVPVQAGFSEIPWTDRGPFSLNPLPRFAARADLDWRP